MKTLLEIKTTHTRAAESSKFPKKNYENTLENSNNLKYHKEW